MEPNLPELLVRIARVAFARRPMAPSAEGGEGLLAVLGIAR